MFSYRIRNMYRFAIGILILSLFAPFLIHAQSASPSALSATIKAAIMKDPRSAGLSVAQIDAMVSALSAKAQTQGVTAQNIAYQPGSVGIVVPSSAVNAANAASVTVAPDTCSLSTWCSAGRYVGGGIVRNWILVSIWILASMLIVVVWLMRRHPHLNGSIEKPEIPVIGSLQ